MDTYYDDHVFYQANLERGELYKTNVELLQVRQRKLENKARYGKSISIFIYSKEFLFPVCFCESTRRETGERKEAKGWEVGVAELRGSIGGKAPSDAYTQRTFSIQPCPE